MKKSGYLFLLLLLFFTGWTETISAQRVSEEQAARETQIEGLRLLEWINDTNIGYAEDHVRPGGGQYLCGGMSDGAAEYAAGVVRSALARIPFASLSKIRMKYVIMCSRVLASGRAVGGLPIPPLKLLMMDMGQSRGYGESLVLHELYHLIEYQFNTIEDARWNQQFGTGYTNSYQGEIPKSPLGTGNKGFLNAYSRTFPHEERAEIFAYMILNPRGVARQIRSLDDKVLEAKIRYMIEKTYRLIGMELELPRR